MSSDQHGVGTDVFLLCQDDERARWEAINAARAAGKPPRHVLRQRVGMPRGVQPMRRRASSVRWWAIAAFALLSLWAVWLAVTL